LENYKALIAHTHPEYWTSEMRDRLEDFLDQGGTLLYLAGNGLFERVEYDGEKMILRDGNPDNPRERFWFRNVDPPRPERAILGVAYEQDNWSGDRSDYAPFAVMMDSHRFFQGTGLRNGDIIGQNGRNGAASGWEMDSSKQLPGHSPGAPPANIQVLAEGTNVGPMNDFRGQITYYDTDAGGFVFAVGSLKFGGSLAVDPKLQQIVQNVLNECLSRGRRRTARGRAFARTARGRAFAPVKVEAARPYADAPIAPARPGGSSAIEIVIGAARVRVPPGIDAATVQAVLHAVKAAT